MLKDPSPTPRPFDLQSELHLFKYISEKLNKGVNHTGR